MEKCLKYLIPNLNKNQLLSNLIFKKNLILKNYSTDNELNHLNYKLKSNQSDGDKLNSNQSKDNKLNSNQSKDDQLNNDNKLNSSQLNQSNSSDDNRLNSNQANELPPYPDPNLCCNSGCDRCIWIQYANELEKHFKDTKAIIDEVEKQIPDPVIRSFIVMQLKDQFNNS